jgi:hypothetical protein
MKGRSNNKKQGGGGKPRSGKPRGSKPSSTSNNKKQGACKDLGIFDIGKGAQDLLTTTWEQITVKVGSTLGEDIRTEMRTGQRVVVPVPTIPASIQEKYQREIEFKVEGYQRMLDAKRSAWTIQRALLEAEKAKDYQDQDQDKIIKLTIEEAETNNAILQLERDIANPPTIALTGEDKTLYDGLWKNHNHRVAELTKHRGQAFSLVYGQVTQALKDEMKHDQEYEAVMTTMDPLRLKALISRAILSSTEDKYV